MAEVTGQIIQIQGGVVDVEFAAGKLPAIYEAIEIPIDEKEALILEVQKHLGNNLVRCVAMDSTNGLQRGMKVIATGEPIMVPVGPATLGRIFNVLGHPVDGQGEVNADKRYSIHRPAPAFDEQSTRVEVFETGVKVIDLMPHLPKAEKPVSSAGPGLVKQSSFRN